MKKLFFYFFSFLAFSMLGQPVKLKSIDSLQLVLKGQLEDTLKCNTYNEIAKLYVYIDSDQGLLFANKGLTLAKKLNWTRGIGTAHLIMGQHQVSKGLYDQAFENFNVTETIFIETNDMYGLATLYNELGILKANQSKLPESLDYFFKSLKNYEQVKNTDAPYNIGNCYKNIGNIYSIIESFDNAIVNYKKAIAILSPLKDCDLEVAMINASIGIVYQQQNKNGDALVIFKAAEKKLIPLKNEFAIACVNSWMGAAYLGMNEYDLSLEVSNKALETVRMNGDKDLTAATIQNIGYAHLKKGKQLNNPSELTLALENIATALAMHKELGNQEQLKRDYLYLSEYYSFKKDYQKSLEAHTNYSLYNDSVFNFKNKQSLQNLQDERTIMLRDNEININKLTIETKEKQKWLFVSGLIFLCVIGILLFYQSRSRKKTNEKLQILNSELDQANKIKATFFSILNHDLRSPVSNLIHFLHLQKESPELFNAESKLRMETKTITAAEQLLTSMEDILLWSKGQMEQFKPQPQQVNMTELFEDIRLHFSSVEKVAFVFENTANIQILSDVNYLKTILRNLTSNAIKALETKTDATIVWKAWEQNNQQYLSITDNGMGATSEQLKALYDEKEVVGIKTGLGLHLIRDLAKAIDCIITVETISDKGTTFILALQKIK
jgi:signal transduction histidine kinase